MPELPSELWAYILELCTLRPRVSTDGQMLLVDWGSSPEATPLVRPPYEQFISLIPVCKLFHQILMPKLYAVARVADTRRAAQFQRTLDLGADCSLRQPLAPFVKTLHLCLPAGAALADRMTDGPHCRTSASHLEPDQLADIIIRLLKPCYNMKKLLQEDKSSQVTVDREAIHQLTGIQLELYYEDPDYDDASCWFDEALLPASIRPSDTVTLVELSCGRVEGGLFPFNWAACYINQDLLMVGNLRATLSRWAANDSPIRRLHLVKPVQMLWWHSMGFTPLLGSQVSALCVEGVPFGFVLGPLPLKLLILKDCVVAAGVEEQLIQTYPGIQLAYRTGAIASRP